MTFIKKLALYIAVLLVYVAIVYSAPFDVEPIAIDSRISIEEFAKYQLKITNNLNQREEYRIYNPEFPIWDIRTEPLINPITLELEPGEEGSVELIVDPLKIKEIGTYGVNVNIRSKISDQLITVPLKVTVLSTEALIGGYVPTVVTSVGIPEKIDPREAIPITIILNNQNVIDYPDMVVKLESNLIKDTIETQLGPKDVKTLDFTKSLNPLTPPQEDELVVAVFKGERSIINPIVRKLEIVEYKEEKLVAESKNFFLAKHNYEIVSNNPDYKGIFKVETSLFESVFSSESPKAEIVRENGKRFFAWDVDLIGNRMEVSITKNFIPLYVVILLLIVLVVLYYSFRSPLVVSKETSAIVKSQGGVSELSVIMRVRNRSKNKIKDIDITDTIPSIVSVEREVSIGSLQPSKILKHEKKGTTIVKWNIDNLDASEERVLSYRIKSKLSILGSFSFPTATAIFRYNDKTQTTTSNRLIVEG